MSPFHTPAFLKWLGAYQPSTQRETLRDLNRALRLHTAGEPLKRRLKASLQRMLHFVDKAHGQFPEEVSAAFLAAMRAYVLELQNERVHHHGSRLPKARKSRTWARSHPDEDWQRLATAVELDETPAGRVLWVMIATGLRIGDVLRSTPEAIEEGLQCNRIKLLLKGGDEDYRSMEASMPAWQALLALMREAKAPTVAALVAPRRPSPLPGDPPYVRVRTRLRHHATQLQLTGRIHLHRLRRTVAIQALQETGDLHLVSRLLGHRRVATTERYLDDKRMEETDKLYRALAKRRTMPLPTADAATTSPAAPHEAPLRRAAQR